MKPTIAAVLLVAFCSGVSHADDYSAADEYSTKIKKSNSVQAMTNGLFGESIDPYTGKVTFRITDVSIPGNNDLDVSISRYIDLDQVLGTPKMARWNEIFGGWQMELPYLHGIFATSTGWQAGSISGVRCNQPSVAQAAPPTVNATVGPQAFTSDMYWGGSSLYVPNQGDEELLHASAAGVQKPTNGQTFNWTTASNWFFACKSQTSNGVAGDAFIGYSPDGKRYYFDHVVSKVAYQVNTKTGSPSALARQDVRILLTRVEDRFGNWVTYTYPSGNNWRLQSIQSSDGRQLNLTYSGPKVISVSDGSRVWQYDYGTSSPTFISRLMAVTNPDGSRWDYNFAGLPSDEATAIYASTCLGIGIAFTIDAPVIIRHPSGAQGTFTFKYVKSGRTFVPRVCIGDVSRFPHQFATFALTKKQISGPGLSPGLIWTWNYPAAVAKFDDECAVGGCPESKEIVMTGPNGVSTKTTFGIKYRVNEGLLLSSQVWHNGSLYSQVTRDYAFSPLGQNYPQKWGIPVQLYAEALSGLPRPLTRTVNQVDGRRFTWAVDIATGITYQFDNLARPTRVIKSSSP